MKLLPLAYYASLFFLLSSFSYIKQLIHLLFFSFMHLICLQINACASHGTPFFSLKFRLEFSNVFLSTSEWLDLFIIITASPFRERRGRLWHNVRVCFFSCRLNVGRVKANLLINRWWAFFDHQWIDWIKCAFHLFRQMGYLLYKSVSAGLFILCWRLYCIKGTIYEAFVGLSLPINQ